MATTEKGTEFYIVEATPRADDADVDKLEEVLRSSVRTGDGVFRWEGRVLVAVAGEVTGAGTVARRFMQIAKKGGIDTKIALVKEPFPKPMHMAALEVILGRVELNPRKQRPDDEVPGDVRWRD